ncbi:glycerophosphodiester phosphodiesterase [Alloacidobacterium dinghuense]|uniref:Glycerophosphodiester phosphodiesterase n=1 Tax=Alloacidobacterium dinghuense TaxID=2763107 RepID=A0A7G8BM60_9BACT|nr:glycerophosphodiester phosphodiesterase family protein [Alloacidobacterium dinghuense]QNI33630.1 glycerophosphodiester phosphodiesterase [Alloacidobacterium dinghuense]
MFPAPGVSVAAALIAFSSNAQTILVHGHRGSRATRPENTIPAFDYAIQHGADVLELDLAVTKDNVLVVSHFPMITPDHPGERVCVGPETPPQTAIYSLTLAQVEEYDCGSNTLPNFPRQVAVPGTKIPTFDQVLDLAPQGSFDFNVETKSFPNHPELTPTPEEFVKLIDDAAKRHNLQSRVILQSFDFRTLIAMKKLDPSIRLSALIGDGNDDAMMGITDHDKDFVSIGNKTGAQIISPDFHLVTPEKVAAAHAAGLQVVPWTANKPEEWQALVDAKVDAIITDDPEALVIWLRNKKPHP